MSSDEKKYTAEDMAKAVLAKAHDMLKAHGEKMEKAEPHHPGATPLIPAYNAARQAESEKALKEKQKKAKKPEKMDKCGDMKAGKLKKFMAKKEEKRIKHDTPEQLKGVDNKKEYTPNPKDRK